MSVDVSPRPAGASDEERFIDEVEHPAAQAGLPGSMSAYQVVTVVVVALVTASLLNSGGLLRAGESMQPGLTRTLTLGVARPADALAQATGLARPQEALASALGHEDLSGGEIVDDSLPTIVVPPDRGVVAERPGDISGAESPPGAGPQDPDALAAALRTPTRGDPLRVLVTGDSLATYVGLQMTTLTAEAKLVDVMMLDRNGTGISNPSYFNWQKAARSDMSKKDPDAVVMIIGGNDGWPMVARSGGQAAVGSDAWVQEYARRTAAVMRTFQGEGRTVYWSGPPTARDPKWNGIYRSINRAVAAAASALPGVRYLDLYQGTSVNGRFGAYVRDEGEKVKARQPDGVHWTVDGARLPARLALELLEKDVGSDLN